MYSYSKTSKLYLSECHMILQNLANRVIKIHDCSVLEGHRGEEQQNEYYKTGKSQLQFPFSKHNKTPSEAIHLAPYFADRFPHIDWYDRERFIYFAGIVKGIASQMPEKPKIRWGGDWDGDNELKDQYFDDLVHFEIIF